MRKLDAIKMRDATYFDWVDARKEDEFQMIPQLDPQKLVEGQPSQVRGLVEGLWEMTHARVARLGLGVGYVFTVLDVMEWFDVEFPNKFIMTRMGAVRVFVYYLPILKQVGILKQIQ